MTPVKRTKNQDAKNQRRNTKRNTKKEQKNSKLKNPKGL